MTGIIELGITQFVRPIGGNYIDKDANIGIGGYRFNDLPEGLLEVVSVDTHDSVGCFRKGSGGVLFRGTRSQIAQWNEDCNGW
jgi:hypothetical protein